MWQKRIKTKINYNFTSNKCYKKVSKYNVFKKIRVGSKGLKIGIKDLKAHAVHVAILLDVFKHCLIRVASIEPHPSKSVTIQRVMMIVINLTDDTAPFTRENLSLLMKLVVCTLQQSGSKNGVQLLPYVFRRALLLIVAN